MEEAPGRALRQVATESADQFEEGMREHGKSGRGPALRRFLTVESSSR